MHVAPVPHAPCPEGTSRGVHTAPHSLAPENLVFEPTREAFYVPASERTLQVKSQSAPCVRETVVENSQRQPANDFFLQIL